MKEKLNLEKINKFFSPKETLDSFFTDYEYRPQQQKMAVEVAKTFNQHRHLLVEAGTGTGKSLAYLVPSILQSLQQEEPIIISTNTINLQEQLIKKDIPALQEIFNFDFDAVLVKGRKNYICLRRLIQYEKAASLPAEGYEVLSNINQWVLNTKTGCRSDLDFKVDFNLWDKISSESDLCLRGNCPYYNQCHFIFARNQAEEADILVVNHHLLFADIALRANKNLEEGSGILPSYKQVVFDEAHNIEEIATNYLGSRVSQKVVIKLLDDLYDLKEGTGLLLRLRLAISDFKSTSKQDWFKEIDNELIPLVRKINETSKDLFNKVINFMQQTKKNRAWKLRLTPQIRKKEFWQQVLVIEFENLSFNLDTIHKKLTKLLTQLINNQDEVEDFEILSVELRAKIEFIKELLATIDEIIIAPKEKHVYWLEENNSNCILKSAPLNINQKLQDDLLDPMESLVFTSATLTVNNSFEFIQETLGLVDSKVDTLQVGSPFDYQNQLRVGVINNFCQPNQHDFISNIVAGIKELVEANQGRSLVLFTSYGMLNKVYDQLQKQLESLEINHLYCQGMKSRQYLIQEFKNKDKAVLLGTDSFWEGVDLPGQELSCVIIVKLPFLVPSEPLVAAKIEELDNQGSNSFFDYMIPKAVIKFKQGFGRLIRTKSDRGWVVILDNRIVNKTYGNIFLKSFPTNSQIIINDLKLITKKIKKFQK